MNGSRDQESTAHSSEESRLTKAMEEYLACLEKGQVPDRDEFLARYADMGETLKEAFDGLEFLNQISPELKTGPRPHQASFGTGKVSLGDFKLIHEIGRGGMGIVYEAEQLSLGRRVAVKVLPFAALLDHRRLDRFKNEARAAAMLTHPNIVNVHSVGCERGVHYYAMDLIEGQSLAEIAHDVYARVKNGDDTSGLEPAATEDTSPLAAISTQRLSDRPAFFRTIADFGLQAARALHFAHSEGVVHRDIKPSNLLVDRQGKVYISDFGLARLETDEELTMTGDIMGTLRYMSPEQAAGIHGVTDHRSDIYSLGLSIYELLVGRPAFFGESRHVLLTKIENKWPARLRQIDSTIPADLESIVFKAIEKEPHSRYATAGEFADDLERFLQQRPVQARHTNRFHDLHRWAKRNRWLATSCALIFVLLSILSVAGPLVALNQRRAAAEARSQLYVQDISVSAQLLRTGNVGLAKALLDKHLPGQPESDLRGFEWHLLNRQCSVASDVMNILPRNRAWIDGGLVRCVAFSPKDDLIAIGHFSNLVRILNSTNGDELSLFRTHGKVTSVAFSSDGIFIAAGTEAGEVRIWNVQTNSEIKNSHNGKLGGIYSVAFSPDGRWLVAGSTRKVTYLWSMVSDGTQLAIGSMEELAHGDGRVFATRFFPQQELLATAASDGVRVWKLNTRQTIAFRPTFLNVTALAVSSDGQLLAIGNTNGGIEAWDYLGDRLTKVAEVAAHGDVITGLEFLSEKRELVSAGDDGMVKIWDLSAGSINKSPLGRDQRLVAVWNPMGRAEKTTLAAHVSSVPGLAVSHDGQRIATGGLNGIVKIWDLRKLRAADNLRTLTNQNDSHWTLSFSPDSDQLVSIGERGHFQIWNLQDGTSVDGETSGSIAMDVSSDGRLIAIGQGHWPFGWTRPREESKLYEATGGGVVEILDAKGRLLRKLTGHTAKVLAVKFAPNGGPLVTAGWGGKVKVWNVDTYTEIELERRRTTPVFGIAFSKDGQLLALATGDARTGDGTVELWRISSSLKTHLEKELQPLHSDWVRGVAFSPTKSLLASASLDGTARIWDLETYDVVHELSHGAWVFDVAFSVDGKTLATCGSDRLTRLWNVSTGGELLQLGGHSSWVTSLAFSPDSQMLATGSHDQTIQLWSAF